MQDDGGRQGERRSSRPDSGPAKFDEDGLGEWLRDELVEAFGLDNDQLEGDRARRILSRLNAGRRPRPALDLVILFLAQPLAFTAPGRYLFTTRGLLHRVRCDDALALALAHELAHHDLGHTRFLDGCFQWARRFSSLALTGLVVAAGERWLCSAERELDADLRALHLCLAAGYDRERCLELFDVLENYALDHGDIDIVFGPDDQPVPPGDSIAQARSALRRWMWERVRGYPCLRDRRAALVAGSAQCHSPSARVPSSGSP